MTSYLANLVWVPVVAEAESDVYMQLALSQNHQTK